MTVLIPHSLSEIDPDYYLYQCAYYSEHDMWLLFWRPFQAKTWIRCQYMLSIVSISSQYQKSFKALWWAWNSLEFLRISFPFIGLHETWMDEDKQLFDFENYTSINKL